MHLLARSISLPLDNPAHRRKAPVPPHMKVALTGWAVMILLIFLLLLPLPAAAQRQACGFSLGLASLTSAERDLRDGAAAPSVSEGRIAAAEAAQALDAAARRFSDLVARYSPKRRSRSRSRTNGSIGDGLPGLLGPAVRNTGQGWHTYEIAWVGMGAPEDTSPHETDTVRNCFSAPPEQVDRGVREACWGCSRSGSGGFGWPGFC
jgi:hypothetical protein